MRRLIDRLLRVAPGEWPKLAPFALLGFLLQMGLGIGFSAGDAAFLARAGADNLALIFMMTPAVMLLYTAIFSYLMVRYSIDRVVDATVGLLVVGGLLSYVVLGLALPAAWELPVYFGLKLYLAMWYIALYSLFWNYTDAYFNIQDGKRLFPLLAAATAFGTTCGGLVVSELAGTVSLRGFFLIWSIIAALTLPVAVLLRRRWSRISDSDIEEGGDSVVEQVGQVATTFRTSRYTLVLTLVLFVTLLMTNLAEFQYSTVFQQGRTEAELASLLGKLYAAANIFNMFVCLFVFNRLVGRIGVRNVALIMPLSYFAAFGFLFVTGSFEGALAAFFAYHGILTSIEYNNQNMLFNAVPSATKRPVRTIVEGMAEPLASFVAGGFLLLAATRTDMRELSGIGVILGVVLLLIVIVLRQLYPAAMARNMQAMLLDFGRRAAPPQSTDAADAPISTTTQLNRLRSPDRAEREQAIARLRASRDIEAVPQILASAAWLAPRERHAIEHLIADWGDTAIPRIAAELGDPAQHHISRALAARALAKLSLPLFASRLDGLVKGELDRAQPRFALAAALEGLAAPTHATRTLARFQRQQIAAATDFAIELLAIGGRLPDFDLLVVSLHSQNAKVRANAIEAIESGTDRATFLILGELIDGRPPASASPTPLLDRLDAGLASTNPIELVATAQTIRDLAPPAELGPRLRRALRPDIGRTARTTIATLLRLDGAPEHTLVDRIAAIALVPDFGAAMIESQTRLATILRKTKPAGEVIAVAMPTGKPLWLARDEVMDLARRYADLALAMYRATDNRSYAA